MIVGNRQRFAIEAELKEIVDGWVLGRFRFWLCGESVGNWEDSVDLKGCARWLRDFSSNPRNRFEASLVSASPEEVFQKVYEPVIGESVGRASIADAYGRFHISHLGMSAFENFDILLLKDASGGERCLWREGGGTVQECRLWRNEMENVAASFCDLFDRELKVVLVLPK